MNEVFKYFSNIVHILYTLHMKTIANYCSFIEFLTQVIYHKALQIIENFFPDGDEVKKISLYLLFCSSLSSYFSWTKRLLQRLARPTLSSLLPRVLYLVQDSNSEARSVSKNYHHMIFFVAKTTC